MLGDLKGSIDTKGMMAIAVLLLMGGYFGMSYLGFSLMGTPGQAEYQQVKVLWDEIQELHHTGDSPAGWSTFQSIHEAEIQQLVVQINKQGPGSDKPLLQSMLMITRDHLPKMLAPDERENRFKTIAQAMSDAAAMAGGVGNQ